MKKTFLLFLLVNTAATFAKTMRLEQMVEVRPGHRLYVQHRPAAPGRPTLFMANGLTFSTKDYDGFADAMKQLDPGVGLVLWDMVGMGKTLLAKAPANYRIPIEEQVEDLHALKSALGIHGQVALAGLSYGGALTLKHALTYPDDFDAYIPIAPMLERLPSQDMWIRQMTVWHMTSAHMFWNFSFFVNNLRSLCVRNMLSWHRMFFPSEDRGEAELTEHYQKALHSMDWMTTLNNETLPDPNDFEAVYDFYLRILIYTTYWIPEPGVLENPFKLEGIFRMVQGVKEWNAHDIAARLPDHKIHAIAALQDEHVKIDRMDAFWDKIPDRAKASYLHLNMSQHKVPTQWPRSTAAWILQILNRNPELQRGFTFEGNPLFGYATHDRVKIPLDQDKEGNCEPLLRAVP